MAETDDRVGPVVLASTLGRAVVLAIVQLNPGAEILDRGAYLWVLSSETCLLTSPMVESISGNEFRLPGDLESVMPAFRGELSVRGDRVEWRVAR